MFIMDYVTIKLLPSMSRTTIVSFLCIFTLTQCLVKNEIMKKYHWKQEQYPEAFFNHDHKLKHPDVQLPLSVYLSMDITQTKMNFNNRILYVRAVIESTWYDPRKHMLLSKGLWFDHLEDYTTFERALNCTWLPSIVNGLNLLNFYQGRKHNQTILVVQRNGFLVYTTSVLFKINCNQITNNFPFDTYECKQYLVPDENNSTVEYRSMHITINDETKADEVNHKLITYNVTANTISAVSDVGEPYSFVRYDWQFTIQRNQFRLNYQFLLPAILIGLFDIGLYTLGTNFVHRFALIPAYHYYMSFIDRNKTNLDWPPIAKFLHARFLSDILLLIWNLAHITTFAKNPRAVYFLSLQDHWKKRLITTLMLTASLYASFTVKASSKTDLNTWIGDFSLY